MTNVCIYFLKRGGPFKKKVKYTNVLHLKQTNIFFDCQLSQVAAARSLLSLNGLLCFVLFF